MNKLRLEEKLTDNFIMYQWRLENPMPTPEELSENTSVHPAIKKYSLDPYFNFKVKNLVTSVMHSIHEAECESGRAAPLTEEDK